MTEHPHIPDHMNKTLDDGTPAGGWVTGVGINIQWQDGPLCLDGNTKEPNGASVEDVIQAAIIRLVHFQNSRFKCEENALAIKHLNIAMQFLDERTTDRVARGVEGTNEK